MCLQKTEKQPYESLPKVWAWDDDKEKGEVAYHIGTTRCEDYPHRVLRITDMGVYWCENVESYKEPSKRPMTFWEALKLKAENPQVAFRSKGNLRVCTDISNALSFENFEHTLDYGETWNPCEVEE